jgi:hypothetical protein
MANIDMPNGFSFIGYADGKSPRGGIHRYYKDATAGVIAVGDPVIRVTNSSDPEGGPEIVRATTGAAITGVVVEVERIKTNLDRAGYLAAADIGYVWVADDPNALFEVQEDSDGGNLAVTNIGEHIDSVTALDADTVRGRSKYELDSSELATNNTWQIVALSNRVGNAVGTNARWIVKANLHTEVNASATNSTEI